MSNDDVKHRSLEKLASSTHLDITRIEWLPVQWKTRVKTRRAQCHYVHGLLQLLLP